MEKRVVIGHWGGNAEDTPWFFSQMGEREGRKNITLAFSIPADCSRK